MPHNDEGLSGFEEFQLEDRALRKQQQEGDLRARRAAEAEKPPKKAPKKDDRPDEPTSGRVGELARQPKLQQKLQRTRERLPALIDNLRLPIIGGIVNKKDILNSHEKLKQGLIKGGGLDISDVIKTPEIITELTSQEIWTIFPRAEDPDVTPEAQKQLIKTIADIAPDFAKQAIEKIAEFEPTLVSGTTFQQIFVDPVREFTEEKFVKRERLTAKEQREKKQEEVAAAETEVQRHKDSLLKPGAATTPDAAKVAETLTQPGLEDVFDKLRESIGPERSQELNPLFALAAILSAAGQRLGGGPGALPLIQQQIQGQQQAEAQRQQKLSRVDFLQAQSGIQEQQEQRRQAQAQERMSQEDFERNRQAVARSFPELEVEFLQNPEATLKFISDTTQRATGIKRVTPVPQ